MRRNIERQKQIVELLSGTDWYLEAGSQPFNASTVTYLLNIDGAGSTINSVRNTLKLMTDKGLVIEERKPAEVRTGLGVTVRQLDHCWNAEAQARDRITVDEYNACASGKERDSICPDVWPMVFPRLLSPRTVAATPCCAFNQFLTAKETPVMTITKAERLKKYRAKMDVAGFKRLSLMSYSQH